MVEMHLAAVRVEQPTNTPVVLLEEVGGSRRTLPIFIGTAEASSIAYALQGVIPPRPLTHDLLLNIVALLGATVERVVVTDLHMSANGSSGTYFAELHLLQGGEARTISSRPSDALALAVRLGIPIFANDDLLDEAGVVIENDDDDDTPPEELVSQFRQFIEGINPEDFSR